jgi:DNA polymerase sigma
MESPEKQIERQLKSILLGHVEPKPIVKPIVKKEKVIHFPTGRMDLPDFLKTPSIEIQKDAAIPFGKKVNVLYKSLLPTTLENNRKKQFFDRLTKIIQKKWPDATLFLFGSSCNLLSIKGKGDMDVCISFEKIPVRPKKLKKGEKEEEEEEEGDNTISKEEMEWIRQKRSCIRMMGSHLERHYMKEVYPLVTARIPILKFIDPETDLHCDICINNTLAVKNTELIGDYCKMDPRVVEMIYFVKHWAKQRKLNEPYQGTLSSYAYVLMVIHYLQRSMDPVLPNLQLNCEGIHWNKKEVLKLNGKSVGYLIMGFFYYFAYEFDFGKDVISIKTEHVTKKELKWTDPEEQRNYFCIEDPFEIGFNVGRSVPEENMEMLKSEFVRALMLIHYKKEIKDVCCEYQE